MDIGAYAQIGDLSELAKANGIEVQRLRGYRLMSEEEPVPPEKVEELAQYCYKETYNLQKYKRSRSKFPRESFCDDDPRQVKRQAKQAYQRSVRQLQAYNKYCGRDDVLMIHARIGGPNWEYFGGPLLKLEPWFLEKVDDGFDNTYCDIYARIRPTKEE